MVWFALLVRFNSGVVAADPRLRAWQVIKPDRLRDVFDRTLATPDLPAAHVGRVGNGSAGFLGFLGCPAPGSNAYQNVGEGVSGVFGVPPARVRCWFSKKKKKKYTYR